MAESRKVELIKAVAKTYLSIKGSGTSEEIADKVVELHIFEKRMNITRQVVGAILTRAKAFKKVGVGEKYEAIWGLNLK